MPFQIGSYTKKSFDKVQYPLMINFSVNQEYKKLLQPKKGYVWKPRANIIFKCELQNAFPLKSRIRKGVLFSPFLFNIVLWVLSSAIKQEKEMKGI